MLIGLWGDTHCDVQSMIVSERRLRKEHDVKIDLALQVGDFGFYKDYGDWKRLLKGTLKFEVPTIAIHGNHENEESAREAMGDFGSLVPNFKCLKEQGEHFVFTSSSGESVSLFGVGGAECVDNPPRNQKFAFDSGEFDTAHDRWLKLGSPVIDILMTHECPYGVGLMGDPRIAAMFGLDANKQMGDRRLNVLWNAMRPRAQFNGHHHRAHEHTNAAGLKHITLPLAQKSFGLLDTSDWSFAWVGVRQ